MKPAQQYPADKSIDASSSLRSTELNGFAYRNLCRDSNTSGEAPSQRCMVLHRLFLLHGTRRKSAR